MSNVNTTTCLMICGRNLDVTLISDRLNLKPTTVTRQEEVVLPTVAEGASRSYDYRMSLDSWKRGLTTKQHRFDIVKQLEFWVEILSPVRNSFQEFKDLGYWSVIDCQMASIDREAPSIQFRLSPVLQVQISRLEIDIDFTIYRPAY
jgi:hypothetical protein